MDTFRKLFQILSMYLLAKIYSDGLSTLSQDRRIAEGVSYSLVCTESSAIANDVIFYKNDVNQGGCAFSTCGSSVAGYSVTQNTTSTTLHIDSVDGTREAGSWTCQHGTDPKSSPFVITTSIPSYLNESTITTKPSQGSIITPPQVIVVSVPCAYPVPTVTWSYSKDGVPATVSGNNVSDPTDCASGQNKLNSSLNTASIEGTGNITLTVKVEHDSFNPANNFARLFTFTVNFGAPTTTPTTPPEPTTATPTSTATTTSTEITKPVCENVIICIIVGCIGGVAVVTVIFICCCCCPCCLPSCFPSKCPCCCRGACKKKRKTGGTNGQTRTTSAEGKEGVPIDDYPTSEKTGGDYLKKRNGGVDSEDILIKIPDGQSDGMRDDQVPKPDGRSEVGMHRL